MGAVFEIQPESVGWEDTRIVGEEAEEDADEEPLEIMAGIAPCAERVVDAGHDLDSFEIEIVLRLERGDLIAGDKGEQADVIFELGERELLAGKAPVAEVREYALLVGLQVVEGKSFEVGKKNVARDFITAPDRLKVVNVIESLGFGCFKTRARRLVLYEELAFPEQIDETVGSSETPNGLLEGGDGSTRDAEDIEELVVEALFVSLFAGCGRPFAREDDGAPTDFVAADRFRS